MERTVIIPEGLYRTTRVRSSGPTMISKNVLRCLIFIVVCTAALSGCMTQRNLTFYLKKSVELVDKMGGDLPDQCEAEAAEIRLNFSDLIPITRKNADTMRIIHRVLRLSTLLYLEDLSSVSWDKSDLNDFRHLLARLNESYRCLKSQHAEVSSPGLKKTMKTMKTNFENMKSYLRSQNNTCAWELLRSEMRTILLRLLRLRVTTRRN